MKYPMACKLFFGVKQGQSLGEFMSEIRSVPEKDKIELCEMLTVKLHETGELKDDEKVELN